MLSFGPMLFKQEVKWMRTWYIWANLPLPKKWKSMRSMYGSEKILWTVASPEVNLENGRDDDFGFYCVDSEYYSFGVVFERTECAHVRFHKIEAVGS
mmetsp:Transcript_13333/g.19614  ORF Transcript_13333/g.19614 Transcript_13333/m.19614 type:complete len:97 (+) Transcript_13333:1060-1350(+)